MKVGAKYWTHQSKTWGCVVDVQELYGQLGGHCMVPVIPEGVDSSHLVEKYVILMKLQWSEDRR